MKLSRVLLNSTAATVALLGGLLNAQADSLSMTVGQLKVLPECGGSLEVTATQGTQVNLIFRDVTDCSNFDILGANGAAVDYPNQKLGGKQRARGGSFTIPKSLIESNYNEITISIASNSKAHSDVVKVKFDVVASVYMTLNQIRNLPECGGTVELRASQGSSGSEQVNLVFRNVESCSNFDIVSANGAYVDYPNKKLGGKQNARSGSFTLPTNVIREGLNRITITLQSDSGKHRDQIVVKFEEDSLPVWLKILFGLMR